MTNIQEIVIRPLHLIEELEEVKKLESSIWGNSESIPTHQTITAIKNGGLVIGAYDGEKLIGFQYSFPGFNGKSSYLCSHILGTDKQYRNKGIGKKLKLAQREEALKLGYSLITWTYDPLESANAYLNIAKLGGVCKAYITNCYGEMNDFLNSGIPSDRFLVEWYIQQEETDFSVECVELDFLIENSLIQWDTNQEGLPFPSSVRELPEPECDTIFVAIPKDFRIIKETNMKTAIEWRMKTRDTFSRLFHEGWQVTDFKKNTVSEIPVQFYVFTKK